MATRECNQCGVVKDDTEFYPNNSKDRRRKWRPECKSCTRKNVKKMQKQRTEYMRRYRARQRSSG